MINYRSYNYKQSCFVAVNLEQQLLPGTFEYTLHYLIDRYLDLSDFDADSAYHPGVLLRIGTFDELARKRDKIRSRIEHALREHQRHDATADQDAALPR